MAHGGKREGAGRKLGIKAKIAEAYNVLLAQEVKREGLPIIQALITKAKTGDVQAIKEIHDRLMGKAPAILDPGDNDMEVFQFVIKRRE
jgi:hypothetical protein